MKTLRDILAKCNRNKVYDIIQQEYYSDKKVDDFNVIHAAYDNVWEELLHKPGKLISETWKVCIREAIDDLPPEPVTYIDVCLLDSRNDDSYAIDMVPWGDIIDYGVVYRDIPTGELDLETTLAHILWEITFYGYTEEEITEAKSDLEELLRRVDSGEEKLIPWEEIKKDLDEK